MDVNKVSIPETLLGGNINTSSKIYQLNVGGKWGFIDEKGKLVVDFEYDDVRPFFDAGWTGVQKYGKWGFIDTEGKLLIDFIFDDADDFYNGLAGVRTKDGWAIINKNGKYIEYDANQRYYTWVGLFNKGLIRVKKGDKVFYIDKYNDEQSHYLTD